MNAMARPAPLAMTLVLRCLLALAWVAPSVAGAESIADRARQMSDDAAQHFKAQRYLEAAELFEQAFALDNSIVVRLRNAGRAWEEANRPERAIHCFTRYLALERDAALRSDAEERIAANRAKLEAAAPADAAASEPTVITKVVVAPPRPIAVPLSTTLASAALIGAGVVWLRAVGAAEDRRDLAVAARTYAYPGGADKRAADDATIRRNRVAAVTTLAVGAAAAGAATWLWLRSEKPQTTLAPTLHPHGAGVAWVGHF